MSSLLEDNKSNEVKNLLDKLIPSYKSNSKVVDHIYLRKLNSNKNVKSILKFPRRFLLIISINFLFTPNP